MSHTLRLSAPALAFALLVPAVASADRRVDRPHARAITGSPPVAVFADYRRSWVAVPPRIRYRVESQRIVRGFGGATFRHGDRDRGHHRAFRDRGRHLGWRDRGRHHALKDRGRHLGWSDRGHRRAFGDRGRHLGWRHRGRHHARHYW